ncbi:MAG: hypothetical protein IPG45_31310 [Deltaproteobacteria bacterium]|nr:hypothetical protein [Deltaproteobacteria bacterium]
MTRIDPRSRTFMATLGEARIAQQPAAPLELPELRAPGKSRAFDPAPLLAAKVPEKVAKAHGPALTKAGEELRALSTLGERLEPWQAKSADRTLEQVYKTLGQLLSAAPPEDTAKIAKQALKMVVALVEATPPAQLLPALAATNGLVDSALRRIGKKSLSLEGANLSALYVDATKAVQDLLGRLSGRSGIGSALHVLPRLVEQVELDVAHSTAAERRTLTKGIAELLEQGPARAGFDLAVVAQVSADLEASRGPARGPAEILAEALQRQHQRGRDGWLATRAGLVALEPGSPPSTRALATGLLQVLDANPAGPTSLFEQIESLRAVAHDHAGSEEASRVELALSKLLPKLATAPTLPAIVEWLAQVLPQLSEDHLLAALEKAAPLKGAPLAAELLKLGHLQAGYELDRPRLAAIDGITKLSAPLATTLVSALLPKLQDQEPELNTIKALIERAPRLGDDPRAELERHLGNQQIVEEYLGHYAFPPRVQAGIRAALSASPITLDEDRVSGLLQALHNMFAAFPKLEVGPLLHDEGEGRTGLLSLTAENARRAVSPSDILPDLCKAAHPISPNAKAQEGAARLVMALADQLSFVFGAQDQVQARVVADLKAAFTNPKKLKQPAGAMDGVALRAQGTGAVAYALAHPELPLDLVFTAGLHLSADDLRWVIDRVQAARGKDPVRLLRDAIFAAVEAKKTGIFTALRQSNSPEAAKTAVLKELAQQFRVEQVNQIDFAALQKGLQAGVDPIGAALAARTQKVLKELDLEALAGGKAVPEGLAELAELAPNVAELLTQYRTEFKSMDHQIDMGKLGPVFRKVLKSVLDGTWPTPKYEDEVGVRQLAMLSPAQREVWRSTTVTLPNQAAKVDPGLAAEARPLLKGLAKALGEHVKVQAPGFDKLAFDAESRDRLRKAYAQKTTAIKDAKKGSPTQRRLARELGPLREALALIELQMGIGTNLRKAKGDLVRALRDSAPLLIAAQPALAKLGSAGLLDTTADLLAMIPKDVTPGRLGRHAADDDSLTAMIASHTSGCLSYGDNRRRWGLAGSLSDANTKMLRAFDGDRQLYRAFMRLVPVEMAGYKGPALYVEGPVGDGGGSYDDLALLQQGLLAKGAAMGIPVLRPSGVPDGWTQRDGQVTITYDYGHVGLYHSDNLGNQIIQGNGGKPSKNERHMTVAFPPGVGVKGRG